MDIFAYDDQVQWNQIQDLYFYVQNIPDIDDNLRKMIDTMVWGFTEMINSNNKSTVLKNIKSLLDSVKCRHEEYENKKYV
nr:hypothetical protein PhopGVgp005 [Phthorimaea operculella granulovirus]QBH65840.1 hypothetical protein PhopGVgp005 [Phthorimaea operculella granulovirus]QBH65970.1 hypothetical protein PhopGVgp005 [Phthorimaea operculella granulovirus]QBH66100.1 hypothetical protein PhopGVgp005 [Phthorimaea operculella granulovirus]QBH66230.1 hypothetical protein PhopGVgp005 [Phthorimaea operculella granulovirus]